MSIPAQTCVGFTMVVLALGAAFKLSLPAQEASRFIDITPNLLITAPRVWADHNQNGIQDEDEPGVEAVKVTLLRVDSDETVAQAATDSSGRCELRVLSAPAHFRLSFELPTGYSFTLPRRGGNESTDSDVNAQGMTTPFFNRSFREEIDAGIVTGF